MPLGSRTTCACASVGASSGTASNDRVTSLRFIELLLYAYTRGSAREYPSNCGDIVPNVATALHGSAAPTFQNRCALRDACVHVARGSIACYGAPAYQALRCEVRRVIGRLMMSMNTDTA